MTVRVNTDIPYGNATDVEIIRESNRTTIAFAADPRGGPECLWFFFQIDNRRHPCTRGPITLLLKYLDTMLGGRDPKSIHPVIRFAGGDWQRLEPGKPAHAEDGREAAWWQIDAPSNWADVAVCYPYGRAELASLLHESGGYWRLDHIGVSQHGRPIPRLSNGAGEVGSGRPGVFLLARQHAGEVSASWVLDGMLRRVAELQPDALLWCAPLVDIDGVEQGDFGKDAPPVDLNRAWQQPPLRHEVIVLTQDIDRWAQRCRPMVALDLHAPGLCECDGLYLFRNDPTEEPAARERSDSVWAERLGGSLGDLAAPQVLRVPRYRSRARGVTARQYFTQQMNIAAFTLECPYAAADERVLTIPRYRQAGARLADALCQGLQTC